MLCDLDQQMEKRADDGKANVVTDALSRKERVKPRRVRAMAMTIQYGVRGMILAAQSEAFKQENVCAERLHGLEQQMERKGDESLYFMDRIWVLLVGSVMVEAHASRLRWTIYPVLLEDTEESVRDAIGFEYCLASSSGWTKVKLYMEGNVGRLFYGQRLGVGPELVQEMTDKVVLVKENSKAVRDCQKSYVDFKLKPLEFELGDRVLLKVTPWKGVVHFRKKGKLAPRYVGPFEILKRIGPVAYRLRLSEELSGVHDTFHVSNLKKCLADASLYVPLDEIKADTTLRFVEEPVEIMDREIKSLKHSEYRDDKKDVSIIHRSSIVKKSFIVIIDLSSCGETDQGPIGSAPGGKWGAFVKGWTVAELSLKSKQDLNNACCSSIIRNTKYVRALAHNGNSVSLKDDDAFIHLIITISWFQGGEISYEEFKAIVGN
ncbi:hypothetical protein Tco_0592685 [Tanacetum coccineum]